MLNLKKGYKEPQCSDKGCRCTSVPPNLSPAVIKNFGASFCKLDEQNLSDAALTKKKKVAVLAPGKKESHAVHTSQRKAAVPTTSGKKVRKKKPPPSDNAEQDAAKDKKKPKN